MIRTLGFAAALAALPMALAAEQPAELPAAEPLAEPPLGDEIVVEAPRTLTPPKAPAPPNRFRGETELVAKVRVGVFYNDLKLADPKDAARLIERIEATARQACAYLDELYPLQQDPDCRKRAVDAAKPAAEAAIAAAQASAAPDAEPTPAP